MAAQIKGPLPLDALTQDLWHSAEEGDVGRLETLLARGVNINARNDAGATALMLAAYHGRLEMVRALTDHGADLNVVDRDGFTAAMLANHSGHQNIVRILLARGAKRIPQPSAYTSSGPFPQEETFDTFDSDPATTESNPDVRTLHEPPDIWDLVNESHAEFNPRSAFLGHLASGKALALVVIALIVGGGAVFVGLKLSAWSESSPAADAGRVEESARTAPDSPRAATKQPKSPVEPARNSQPPQPVTTESRSVQQLGTTLTSTRLAGSIVNPKPAAAAVPATDKKTVAKPRQKESPRSITNSNASPANTATESPVTAPKPDNAAPK